MSRAKCARSQGHAAENVSAWRLLQRYETVEEKRIEPRGQGFRRRLIHNHNQSGLIGSPPEMLLYCAVMAKIVTLPSQFVVPVKLRMPYVYVGTG